MDAFGYRLGTGGLDSRQAIREHGGENRDQPADPPSLNPGQVCGEPAQPPCGPTLSRRVTIPERAGFAGQDGDVMPRIVDCLAAPMVADVFRDNATILANDDAIGIGMDLHRATPDGAGVHRVLVVVEAAPGR